MVLSTAEPLQRHIARGEEHRFQLALTGGTAVDIVVEQRGIDVVVAVRDVDGKPIGDFQDEIRRDGNGDRRDRRPTTGTYTIAIKPADSAVTPGDYVIHVTPPETPPTKLVACSSRASCARAAVSSNGQATTPRRGHCLSNRSPLRSRCAKTTIRRGDGPVRARRQRARSAGQRAIARALRARSGDVRKQWGPTHPYAAMSRSRLALLDQRAGQRLKAEAGIRAKSCRSSSGRSDRRIPGTCSRW